MEMKVNIPLFDLGDMKTGRGGRRGTGKKYGKYAEKIEPAVEFFKDAIARSKDGAIRVKVEDVAQQIGMVDRNETSIYWGLKFVLFQKGIVVTTGRTKKDEAVLIMREKKDNDVLPASLARHLEGKGEGRVVDEGEGEGGEGEAAAAGTE